MSDKTKLAGAALVLAGGSLLAGVGVHKYRSKMTPLHVRIAQRDVPKLVHSGMADRGTPLATIFKLSGWSNYVDRRDGRVMDWCGMTVAKWAYQAGLAAEQRRTFWHTTGVRAFFTYGRKGSDRRYVATANGQDIERAQRNAGKPRLWSETTQHRNAPLAEWDIASGDVVLIAHKGQTSGANHIALVEHFRDGWLTTLEGNASGYLDDGTPTKSGLVRKHRDLRKREVRNTIYGFGRFSPMDFSGGVA